MIKYILVICVIVLASCNNNSISEIQNIGERKNILTLIENNNLDIPIDSQTPYSTMSMAYYVDTTSENNTNYLVYLNQNTSAIQFYDLEKKELTYSIKLKEEGPDDVGRPSGFKVINRDSIYIVSGYKYQISLINKEGKILNYCSLLKSEQGRNEETGMPQGYTPMPLYIINDRMYMNIAPDRNVFSEYFYEGHTNMSLNFSTCDFFYFNTYPNSFKGNVWGSIGTSFSTAKNNKNQFVYSFAPDENIYVYDPVSDATKIYYAGSENIDKINPMENWDMSEDKKYVYETANYGSIIYDEYRKVYYRIVKYAIAEIDEYTQEHNAFYDKPFSIIILDEEYNIVGEKEFPGKKYNFNNYFLTEEGLYISKGNDKNPELNEDELSYTLLKLETL